MMRLACVGVRKLEPGTSFPANTPGHHCDTTRALSCALQLQMDQEISRNNDHSDHYVVKIEMILFKHESY